MPTRAWHIGIYKQLARCSFVINDVVNSIRTCLHVIDKLTCNEPSTKTHTHTKLSLICRFLPLRFTTFSTISDSEAELIHHLYYLYSPFTLECPFRTGSLYSDAHKNPIQTFRQILIEFCVRIAHDEPKLCLNNFQLKIETKNQRT